LSPDGQFYPAKLTGPSFAGLAKQLPAPESDPLLPVDVIRQALSTRIGQPLSLEFLSERGRQDWLLVSGVPRQPDGAPLDYSGTLYQHAIDQGTSDEIFTALLQETSDSGDYSHRELTFGSTDTPVVTWPGMHPVPVDLLNGNAGVESLQW
jgi:hypothetical protein